MNESEKYSAGAEARRGVPGRAYMPDEPLRQDALMRYLGAIAAVSAAKAARPAARAPRTDLVVSDLMAVPHPSVTADTALPDIARALSEHGIGSLPVVDTDDRVLGVVSEADLLAVVAAQAHRPSTVRRLRDTRPAVEPGKETAEALMTSPAITVLADTTVPEAAWLVALTRLKRLPVTEADGRLVGTVERHTLLDALLQDDAAVREGVEGRVREMFPEAADTVEVTVHEGVVRLRGPVAGDDAARLLAEVKGLDVVTAVIDELTVRDG
ncbi:CBS domain-containing protein [Streptomyces sp. NBC_01439]|uniref:CBS domain-containing protein n=1 Tax=Streptomyces sp. NBC_01439 TaxID=2903867 RepID=UPI002E2DC4AF|nr:CBS domain-containing protein [Streptomyces sp. NBC_01439]